MAKALTVSEAFELYQSDYIVYRNQSKKTEENHLLVMKSFVGFVGDITLSNVTFQMVRDWKEHLESYRAQNTVRNYIVRLRVVLGYMKIRGYKVLDPEAVGIPKRQTTVVDFITEDDVTRLIEATFIPISGYRKINRYRNRALISLLYASGVRVSELCGMNISDINMTDCTFTVIGKGNKPRLCFFDERTRRYLHDYLALRSDHNPALFLSDQTQARIKAGVVQVIFRLVRVKAGFTRPIHPHTMRHSYATNLLRNNTNLVYVRDFLGHSSVQTTEMYTHVVNEDLRRIYNEKHTV